MNLDDLSIDDIVDLEEKTGYPASVLFGPERDKLPQGNVLKAIAWIALRKDDPSFTWDDAGKLTFAEIQASVTNDEAEGVDPPEEETSGS